MLTSAELAVRRQFDQFGAYALELITLTAGQTLPALGSSNISSSNTASSNTASSNTVSSRRPHRLCLLTADFTRLSNASLAALVQSLVDQGVVYFVCWGPGCAQAHDLIEDLTLLIEGVEAQHAMIMVTSHANDTLAEAILFLLTEAWPDRAYQQSTEAMLAVTLDQPEAAQQIAVAMAEPEHFIAKYSQ
ncbi:MAG: hypothetical protein HRU21_13125 [Pseudomonadales bacterium]|nr:hypothetical protein [Pseudomonadales bacterium]